MSQEIGPGLQSVDELFETTSQNLILESIDLPKARLIQPAGNLPEFHSRNESNTKSCVPFKFAHPIPSLSERTPDSEKFYDQNPVPNQEMPDFHTVFRAYSPVLIKHFYSNLCCERSFPLADSLSREDSNRLGKHLFQCHVHQLLEKTKEDKYNLGTVTSVKWELKDKKKSDRIGLSLKTFNRTDKKEHWIQVTSDSESIFITKDNGYHRTLKTKLIGNEATQSTIEKILDRDKKRLFGEKPNLPQRQTYLQTIPSNTTSPTPHPF